MQLFKYILLDQLGKTRIGYIEGENKDAIAKKFQATGVQQILSIDTFTLANVNLLDRRKFFSFSATTPEGKMKFVACYYKSDVYFKE